MNICELCEHGTHKRMLYDKHLLKYYVCKECFRWLEHKFRNFTDDETFI